MRHLDRLVVAAMLLCVAACAGFGGLLDGYSHMQHPLALPGATAIPRALAFNLLCFVLPGLLLAAVAWRLRDALPPAAGMVTRLGTSLLLLAALAFAAQGVFPLDPEHLDAGASRLHAAAWTAWWIAFVTGAALLAIGIRPLRPATLAALLVVLPCGVLLPQLLGAGLGQRLSLLAWFAWTWHAARTLRPAAHG